MNTLQREAMRWLDAGIVPIPLRYRSKQPVVKWRQWYGQLPPTELVNRWFAGLRNMAIIISGELIVLDFDIAMFYHKWRIAHPDIAITYTVKSRRGYHVYFYAKSPTETANMEGGEILASGHMLTVPPSTHESGHVYLSVGGGDILTVSGLNEIGIVPIEKERVAILADLPESNQVWLPVAGGGQDWGESPVEYVKRRVDMFDLLIRMGMKPGSGKTVVMQCPFHEDKNPSFQVWHDGAYCHSTNCVAHRQLDVIGVAALYWRVSQGKAIGILAGMA